MYKLVREGELTSVCEARVRPFFPKEIRVDRRKTNAGELDADLKMILRNK